MAAQAMVLTISGPMKPMNWLQPTRSSSPSSTPVGAAAHQPAGP